MAAMKLRHAATLAMVVWYLMQLPLPHLNTHAVHKDSAATLEASTSAAAIQGLCGSR
jgi:hypothetical protein